VLKQAKMNLSIVTYLKDWAAGHYKYASHKAKQIFRIGFTFLLMKNKTKQIEDELEI
jgi:hypothetical protein